MMRAHCKKSRAVFIKEYSQIKSIFTFKNTKSVKSMNLFPPIRSEICLFWISCICLVLNMFWYLPCYFFFNIHTLLCYFYQIMLNQSSMTKYHIIKPFQAFGWKWKKGSLACQKRGSGSLQNIFRNCVSAWVECFYKPTRHRIVLPSVCFCVNSRCYCAKVTWCSSLLVLTTIWKSTSRIKLF